VNHRSLAAMPDAARLWIFAAPRALSEAEAESLLSRVDGFLTRWNAHGPRVGGAREWRHDHFLLIAADEEATGVSGCSIDSLFRVLKEAEAETGVSLLDSSRVWYRDSAGEVRSATRPEFRLLAEGGEVDAGTTVFDNTAATVGALRVGEWERPMRESWHGRAFPVGSGRAG
jgi:hypothetical protein